MCVEVIAACYLRKRRVYRAERGLIANGLAERRRALQDAKIDADELQLPLPCNETDSLTDHLALPAKEDIDKLLRYETMIDTQMQRAVEQLEELQMRRRSPTDERRRNPEAFAASDSTKRSH